MNAKYVSLTGYYHRLKKTAEVILTEASNWVVETSSFAQVFALIVVLVAAERFLKPL